MAFLRKKKSRKGAVEPVEAIAPIAKPADAPVSTEIAQEMYRKNVELAHTNQTLSLLRTIDSLVLETDNSIEDLIQGIADALVNNTGYLYSAVFMRSTTEQSRYMGLGGFAPSRTSVLSRTQKDHLKDLKVLVDAKWLSSSKSVEILGAEGLQESLHGIFNGNYHPLLSVNEAFDAQTMCVVKLMTRKKLVGLLIVGLQTPSKDLHIRELEYLGRVGEASGIALDNKVLFEENKRVLRELRRTNEKLKALDEAKDEFISMASHQLRTPLTSVKGYVSMVLDGDVGPINEQQHKLLEQAFTSSQRMVYLIADLLNVSRLRTGKFVIELKPTYLPDVVEGEMQQLVETAAARGLELAFEKPASFPTLNLDETKIRQVVMNFMDNAIYYTPAGGHIRVELEAKDNAIEYRVVDDGLGVPKADQHHLFAKFYRAGNARKARPDGTGLGLFMAKKVVIAQGGAIIFKSREGEGSTFGFSFPRAGIEVQPEHAAASPETVVGAVAETAQN